MPLSPLPSSAPWSVAVRNAYQQLFQIYETAFSYVDSGSLEPHRLQQYGNSIITDAYPLLLLLEESSESELIPNEWIETAAHEFTELLALVDENWMSAKGESDTNVRILHPVYTRHTRKPGRPRKEIDPDILKDALQKGRRIPQTVLANILGISCKTLQTRIKELGIDTSFDKISNDELDELVRKYQQENPDGGRAYLIGRLRSSNNLRIQRKHVVDSMNRVNRLGQGMREKVGEKKKRRRYSVPRPNALWHIDGHHKLISWGIVIHGVADGYSRTVTGLRASTNNRAETVLDMFIDAVLKYGVPSRLRGDRGGENRDVSILMILLRGLDRASFMWGSSVFNTRIERLWVEAGKRFVRLWRAFFMRLERLHLLQRKNPKHLWLLHHLFLNSINDDSDKFCQEWNAHPISGEAKGYSPNDMVFMGELVHGVYVDDCEDLDVEEINAFFGFDENGGPLEDDSGSDGLLDEEEEQYSDAERMTDASDSSEDVNIDINTKVVDSNIRHDAIPVPSSSCPFTDDRLYLFEGGLQMISESGDLPEGYGVTAEELGADGFDEQEEIKIGLQRKAYPITIPRQIWQSRTELWAQGLFVMNTLVTTAL